MRTVLAFATGFAILLSACQSENSSSPSGEKSRVFDHAVNELVFYSAANYVSDGCPRYTKTPDEDTFISGNYLRLLEAGYTPEEIRQSWANLDEEEYFQSILSVKQDFGYAVDETIEPCYFGDRLIQEEHAIARYLKLRRN